MVEHQIRYDDGAGYERYMGSWSRLAGEVFLDWLAPRPGLRWIDIGCGNGAFTELLVQRCAPAEVQGIDPSEAQLAFARARPAAHGAAFHQGDAMTLPFPRTVRCRCHGAGDFLHSRPGQGVAEMVRVVCPGGTVTTYAWDMLGGGFPLEPIQAEMRAMGLKPVLPPSARITDGCPAELVDGGGPRSRRDAGDHGAADVRRFRRILDDLPVGREHSTDGRRNGVRRCRTAQDTGARAPAGRRRGAHYLRFTRQRDKGAHASVITPPETPGLWKRGLAFSEFETVGIDQTIMQGASRRTFRYKSRGLRFFKSAKSVPGHSRRFGAPPATSGLPNQRTSTG